MTKAYLKQSYMDGNAEKRLKNNAVRFLKALQ